MQYHLFSLIFTIVLTGSETLKVDTKPELIRLKHNNPGLIVDLGVGLWANPIPVDWDQDGDLDLLANSVNTELYRNIGSKGDFVFQFDGDLSSVVLGGHSTSPTTVDWNGDGVRDLLIGAEDGFFYYLPRKK